MTDAIGAPSHAQISRAIARLDRRLGLDSLWLFGSGARDAWTRWSDVDLAAFFRRPTAADDILEMAAELEEVFGRQVDLIDLDRASPVVVMQVLRTGRLLLDANPERRRRLAAGAPGRYEDLLLVRRPIERAILERARRGRS